MFFTNLLPKGPLDLASYWREKSRFGKCEMRNHMPFASSVMISGLSFVCVFCETRETKVLAVKPSITITLSIVRNRLIVIFNVNKNIYLSEF